MLLRISAVDQEEDPSIDSNRICFCRSFSRTLKDVCLPVVYDKSNSIFVILRPHPPPQKPISAQVRSNGLKFGAYVGAEVRRLW